MVRLGFVLERNPSMAWRMLLLFSVSSSSLLLLGGCCCCCNAFVTDVAVFSAANGMRSSKIGPSSPLLRHVLSARRNKDADYYYDSDDDFYDCDDDNNDDDDDDDFLVQDDFGYYYNEYMLQRRRKVEEKVFLVSRRRSMMATMAISSVLVTTPSTTMKAYAKTNNGLPLTTAPNSGLKWADAKIGGTTGGDVSEAKVGSRVAIDYSMASTVGRFPQIYTTKDKGEPYSWTIGDGTTIKGVEMAILGNKEDQIPPMKPGGIRRIIIPNTLGYNQLISKGATNELSPTDKNKRCIEGNDGSIGPIPPKDASDGAYQRWYQLYCNPRIPYQPDIVMDIKLYRVR